jgi:hypothetical protein
VYEESTGNPGPSTGRAFNGADPRSASDRQNPSLHSSSLSIVQPTAASLATIVAESNIEALNPWIKEHGTSVHNLLHHFSNNSATIMGQPLSPQFWDLACRYNFLVSTMLAVSACHLRHYTLDPAPHHIAELGQESAAITALKSALALPLHKDRADALLFTAVMLNAVTFAFVENHSLSTSWVFSNGSDRLGWLDLQLQFKKLEEATSQFRESSLLQPILDATDHQDPQLDHAEDLSLEGVPTAWRMLIGDKDTQNYRLYRRPVQILAELRLLEPDCNSSFAYFGLVGKLEEGFRNLLFDKDPRALWIFGYWLGLLGRLNIWWCKRRVERDWAAVLCFLQEKELDQRPDDKGRMWQALITDLSVASEWPPPQTENIP